MVNLRLALSVWLTSPFLLIRRSSLTTLLTNLVKWQPVPSVNKSPSQRKLLFWMFPESFHPSFSHQLWSSFYWQYDKWHNCNNILLALQCAFLLSQTSVFYISSCACYKSKVKKVHTNSSSFLSQSTAPETPRQQVIIAKLGLQFSSDLQRRKNLIMNKHKIQTRRASSVVVSVICDFVTSHYVTMQLFWHVKTYFGILGETEGE